MEDTFAELFLTMRSELQADELHSNFDHLSFYRRAYSLVLKIRKEILFDHASQIARRADAGKNPEPTDQNLLADLLEALKIKPKKKNVASSGDEVSAEVVPLDQLKRIAKLMEGVILEEGGAELKRAKMRLGRDWDGLKAECAADEAKARDVPSTVEEAGIVDEEPRQPEQTAGTGNRSAARKARAKRSCVGFGRGKESW